MKKIVTLVFAMLLTGSLAFAQAAPATASPESTSTTKTKKAKKTKKSKKSTPAASPSPAAK